MRDVGADWFELVPVIGKALKLVSRTLFKWQSTDDIRDLAERKGNKEKLVQQYVQMLKLMSDKHPLVLFVDDLHWADDSSIYLLFQLAREIQDRRILILGTYRPTDIQVAQGDKPHPLKDALSEMHRYAICQEVKLGYFTPDHIRRYLDVVFPQHRLDAAFVEYLHDLTEGNPLFVTEQVKLLKDIGKITDIESVWQLRGTVRDADMPIPTSVEKTIEKRFERLKEGLQETLQYASISGEQFDSAVLAQMLQRDELDILKQLQTLDRVYEFVREQKADTRPTMRGSVYQFIHSLVQKALYSTLSDGIKRALHAKAAEIIESLYPEQREDFAEELATHWERGREYAKAASYLLLAAQKANRQSGYQEARAHAQHGLDVLNMAGAKTSDQMILRLQIDMLIELATAEEAFGEAQLSIDHAETAANLAKMVEDQGFQGHAFYQIGNLFLLNQSTNYERILQVLDASLSLKIATNDHEHFAGVLEKIRISAWALGKGEYCLERCQEVLHLNQQTHQENLNVAVLQLIARILHDLGKYQEAYDTLASVMNIALASETPYMQIEFLQQSILYALRANNTTKAAEYYAHAKHIASSVQDVTIKSALFYTLGEIAWSLNQYTDMTEFYHIAKEAAESTGDVIGQGTILSTLKGRHRAIGQFEDAIQYGMEYLEFSQKSGRVQDRIDALNGLAFIFRYQGNYSKAIEMRQQVVTLLRKYGRESSLAHCLGAYYTDLRLIGNFPKAIDALTEALLIYKKRKDVNLEVDFMTNLAVCQFFSGHLDEALSMLHQALLLKQNIVSQGILIRLSMRHSQILIGMGQYRKAYDLLEPVVEESIKREDFWGDTPIHLLNSAYLYLGFNDLEKSFNRIVLIEKCFEKHASLEITAMLKDAYAQVYLAQGDIDKATTSINKAIALFQQMNSYRLGEAYLTLAAIELEQQQPATALQYATEAGNMFKAIEYYRYGETILMEVRAHLALSDYPQAQTRLRLAAAEFERLQQPHYLAVVKLIEAQVLYHEHKNKEQTVNMLHDAKTTFKTLGLKRSEDEAIPLIEMFNKY